MIPTGVQPLVVAATATGDGVIEFRTRTERIVLDDQTTLVNEILRLCDGRNTVETISKKVSRITEVDAEHVSSVIEDLMGAEVLVDSRRFVAYTHLTGNNPMFYSHLLSDEDVERIQDNRPSYLVDHTESLTAPKSRESHLRDLLDARISCRSFSSESISRGDFIAICEQSYGNELGPVPSGGALYPLSVFLIVRRDGEGIESGVYQYDPFLNCLNTVQTPVDDADAMYALNSDTLLHGAAGVVVIAGDLERHPSKYSNRGYRYTLIEAGHVAQCATLSAIELGYSVLEYGGFNDEPLKQLLHIDSNDVWPLVCVAIGKPDNSVEVQETGYAAVRKSLEGALVGRSKPLNWATTLYKETGDSNTPFYSAAAHYKPGPFHDAAKSYDSRIAAGTSPSQDLALIKAMAEGFERFSFTQPRLDVRAKAEQLDAPWVDPNIYTPFTDWQFQQFGFMRFDPSKEWEWVKGEDSNGALTYVPTDLVFYPFNADKYGRRLCYAAHSNGCAAHTTLEAAKLNAVHELLERDAIITNWLLQTVPKRIPLDLLPLHWQRRVLFWREQGWTVDAVDLSHSGVAIASVYARKRHARPYLAHGSAASSVSFEYAVDKAFQELEIAMSVQAGRRSKRVPADEVDTPNDHGQVYHFDDFAHKLDYLFDGSFIKEIPSVGGPDVIKSFDPIYVTMSSSSSPLQVVRALSAKLVPINFGYGRDHISHNNVKEWVDQTSAPFPHYLA